ncbi:MAG: tol-pal system protein YbgF [Gammaproteobacteria bacterium]|nr:tol-pal system protein YbgF [Gammaproteobacteria bacterium]
MKIKLAQISYRIVLVPVLLAAGNSPAIAQNQALTPEQLTQQIRVLDERSQNSASVLTGIQQDVKKVSRLLDNQAMLELMQTVDELAGEISILRGELEQQTHDIGGIKKRQRELYLDIDRRLRDLESRTATQAPPDEPVQVPGIEQAAAELPSTEPTPSTAPVDVASTGLISDTATTSTTDSKSTQPTSSATNSEEQAAYQEAFDILKEGRYKMAKVELKRFLKKYPDSSFAGNTQYWLGEANYVTRNFEQGIIEFELVLSRYPSSSKVPDAMLKLGYTHYERKKYNKARIMLLELTKRYPNASAARLAGKRLDRMRKEGH